MYSNGGTEQRGRERYEEMGKVRERDRSREGEKYGGRCRENERERQRVRGGEK